MMIFHTEIQYCNDRVVCVLQIEMNEKYQGLTCGLCGNFNSVQADEFLQNGKVPSKLKNL